MYYVYVLYSKGFNKFYIGIAADCEKRLAEHNAGRTSSNKAYIPWEIVHIEEFATREESRKREKYLKSAVGRRWRKAHIERPRGATE